MPPTAWVRSSRPLQGSLTRSGSRRVWSSPAARSPRECRLRGASPRPQTQVQFSQPPCNSCSARPRPARRTDHQHGRPGPAPAGVRAPLAPLVLGRPRPGRGCRRSAPSPSGAAELVQPPGGRSQLGSRGPGGHPPGGAATWSGGPGPLSRPQRRADGGLGRSALLGPSGAGSLVYSWGSGAGPPLQSLGLRAPGCALC